MSKFDLKMTMWRDDQARQRYPEDTQELSERAATDYNPKKASVDDLLREWGDDGETTGDISETCLGGDEHLLPENMVDDYFASHQLTPYQKFQNWLRDFIQEGPRTLKEIIAAAHRFRHPVTDAQIKMETENFARDGYTKKVGDKWKWIMPKRLREASEKEALAAVRKLSKSKRLSIFRLLQKWAISSRGETRGQLTDEIGKIIGDRNTANEIIGSLNVSLNNDIDVDDWCDKNLGVYYSHGMLVAEDVSNKVLDVSKVQMWSDVPDALNRLPMRTGRPVNANSLSKQAAQAPVVILPDSEFRDLAKFPDSFPSIEIKDVLMRNRVAVFFPESQIDAKRSGLVVAIDKDFDPSRPVIYKGMSYTVDLKTLLQEEKIASVCEDEEELVRYAAVDGAGKTISAVKANNEDEARQALTEKLNKKRKELDTWRKAGERVVRQKVDPTPALDNAGFMESTNETVEIGGMLYTQNCDLTQDQADVLTKAGIKPVTIKSLFGGSGPTQPAEIVGNWKGKYVELYVSGGKITSLQVGQESQYKDVEARLLANNEWSVPNPKWKAEVERVNREMAKAGTTREMAKAGTTRETVEIGGNMFLAANFSQAMADALVDAGIKVITLNGAKGGEDTNVVGNWQGQPIEMIIAGKSRSWSGIGGSPLNKVIIGRGDDPVAAFYGMSWKTPDGPWKTKIEKLATGLKKIAQKEGIIREAAHPAYHKMNLDPADEKVLTAFQKKQKAEGKTLSTDGVRLFMNGKEEFGWYREGHDDPNFRISAMHLQSVNAKLLDHILSTFPRNLLSKHLIAAFFEDHYEALTNDQIEERFDRVLARSAHGQTNFAAFLAESRLPGAQPFQVLDSHRADRRYVLLESGTAVGLKMPDGGWCLLSENNETTRR